MVIHKTIDTTDIVDEDDLDKPNQMCDVQGTIGIGTFPKWRQKGEDELIRIQDRYLCVKINEANVFGDLNDGGDAKVWIDVTWAGVTKMTRQFKRQNVNQTLYFKILIPASSMESFSLLEEYLQDELQSKSEFMVSVWVDTHKTTIDNMGMGKMCLSSIAAHGVSY